MPDPTLRSGVSGCYPHCGQERPGGCRCTEERGCGSNDSGQESATTDAALDPGDSSDDSEQ
eukprot:1598404-Lingulodinium_polyedra.AAC.1